MEALTPWHLALILLGFLVLFGYKKLPDASRSLGRSLRIFRAEMREAPGDNRATGPRDEPADVAALEAQARAAEAHARALRARADQPGPAPAASPPRPGSAEPSDTATGARVLES